MKKALVVAAGVVWTACWFWAFSFGFSSSFFRYDVHSRVPPLLGATLAVAIIFASWVWQWQRNVSVLNASLVHLAGVGTAMCPFLIVAAVLRHAPEPWRPSADDAMGIGIDFLILLAVGVLSMVSLAAGLGVRHVRRRRRRTSL